MDEKKDDNPQKEEWSQKNPNETPTLTEEYGILLDKVSWDKTQKQ